MAALAGESRAILYGYWLSSCTWRVRAALSLKQIPFEEKSIDIVKQRAQLTDEYRAVNPSQKVPALVIGHVGTFSLVSFDCREEQNSFAEVRSTIEASQFDNTTLVESMAILQYLEETRATPTLLPNTPLLRARMREICETIVSGIQPLQNVGLMAHFSNEEQYINFTKYWTGRGLQTLEELLQKTSGRYCVADRLSMADLCLVPQLYNAVSRHKLTLDKYPTVSSLYEKLLEEKCISDTHPEKIRQKKITI